MSQLRVIGRATCGLALLSLLGSCRTQAVTPDGPPIRPSELLPGGRGSTSIRPTPNFTKPATDLVREALPDFYAGRALAKQPWVRAPATTTARDGLGPLYNARSCVTCHIKGGRGEVPQASGDPLVHGAMTLSVSSAGLHVSAKSPSEMIPDPTYGFQLQTRSVALSHQFGVERETSVLNASAKTPQQALPEKAPLPAEGALVVHYQRRSYRYPDGSELELREPRFEVKALGYGPMHPDVATSVRVTPPMYGMGLLEGIAKRDLDRHVDPDDRDGDGISGRRNRVRDRELGEIRPGRFGWKANQPSLKQQVAAALSGDLGITSAMFPEQPCTDRQPACLAAPHGTDRSGHEIDARLLALLVDFTRSLGVPKRRLASHPMVRQGREAFYRARCQACHIPSYTTEKNEGTPHVSEQTIWPYTDLLLHDMGAELADGRPEFDASGSEWRTPPLWGIGLSQAVNTSSGFLHDGRARTVEEAIVWHGGEATQSRDAFAAMPADDRAALIAFVKSL